MSNQMISKGITPDLVKLAQSAAAYVRMSTEHQEYSTDNQMEVIRDYALRRGLEIIMVYSDEGKSGLRIKGRAGLNRMLNDVTAGNVSFRHILVYDISRWGRFQNADESAHYEFICRKAGIKLHFCAEQFENDGSPVSTIVKGVKRAMSGEYSRELSAKVFHGACRLIRLGYKQGGTAGYGLRRLLIDQAGRPKEILKIGEQKSIQTDRVVLVPGPDEEIETVRWIFHAFVVSKLSEREIAESLNKQGIVTDFGRPWTKGTVHQILTNEKYIGNNVYCRTSFKLKEIHVKNDPEDWVRLDGAWKAIVEKDLFLQARDIILKRSQRLTDEEMLSQLAGLLETCGRLSGIIIDEQESIPSSSAFRSRFGSLVNAYSLIGYEPAIDYAFVEENRRIRRLYPEVQNSILNQLKGAGATVTRKDGSDILFVNEEFTVSLVLCRHSTTQRGTSRWVIRFDTGLRPDITIAARLEVGNASKRDYFLLPSIDMTCTKLRVGENNSVELDGYQFDDLGILFMMSERTQLHV
ncbi:MAG: recombinase family protein [Verrucomicrobiales bacterium]